jgi:hypothetical protein
MYEAKSMIMRLLKMTVERDRMMKKIKKIKMTTGTEYKEGLA